MLKLLEIIILIKKNRVHFECNWIIKHGFWNILNLPLFILIVRAFVGSMQQIKEVKLKKSKQMHIREIRVIHSINRLNVKLNNIICCACF